MTLVVDASTVIAALVDSGPQGRWADRLLESDVLVAPHLLLVEVANVLRRAAVAGEISGDSASLAHSDLLGLSIHLLPYEPFADRIWELGTNLSAYDAWYVAIAESEGAPLATLDRRLSRSSGTRCRFELPPG